ncbi:hypothetical protein Angca_008771, partial [Angiostrongylus cantonensis]
RKVKTYIPDGPKQAFVANANKNRYNDILLLDSTRVILKDRENDYIHASRVMVGRNMFICTQGPLCNTAESFWAMIIQEKVKLIVMLCRFIEEGKEKCYEYFPKSEGRIRIGKFTIDCKSREALPDADGATCGKLEITYMGRKMRIEHLWYENWLDHAAPDNFRATFKLIRITREKRLNAPVVVHCSAGVGRSGCFVAVELALHEAATKSVFKMDTVLKDLRDQRMHCIQSDMQYLYIHRGLVEFLIERGVTKRGDVMKFITDYDNLIRRKRSKGESLESKESRQSAEVKKKDFIPEKKDFIPGKKDFIPEKKDFISEKKDFIQSLYCTN